MKMGKYLKCSVILFLYGIYGTFGLFEFPKSKLFTFSATMSIIYFAIKIQIEY